MECFKFADGRSLSWTMYDGDQLNRAAYKMPNMDDYTPDQLMGDAGMKLMKEMTKGVQPCRKVDYDTVIMNNFATLIWQDDSCSQICTPLKAENITIGYIINSVMFYYKKTNKLPSRVCMLDYLMYDSQKHIIYLQFGS